MVKINHAQRSLEFQEENVFELLDIPVILINYFLGEGINVCLPSKELFLLVAYGVTLKFDSSSNWLFSPMFVYCFSSRGLELSARPR